MSLTEVLGNLSQGSKLSFLENFLSHAATLDDDDFVIARDAALELSVDLGVKYLLIKGEKEEAITALEESERYVDAAELCKELGMKDRAVSNFERAGGFGNIKKAVEAHLGVEYTIPNLYGAIKGRIGELERAEQHIEAADLSKRHGMIMRAIENYRHGGNNEEADRLLNFSDIVKAAKVWEDNAYPIEACNLLFLNGLDQELAATQERAGYLVSAASTYERLGHLDLALRLYKQAEFDHGVENILREQGKIDELVAYWHETNNLSSLARHYRDKDPKKAADFYVELKDYQNAAQSLIEAERSLEAMQLLVDNELREDALRIGESIDDLDGINTAELDLLMTLCYEELAPRYEVSNPRRALEFYSKSGDQDNVRRLATNLMEQAAANADFKSAAEYALMTGDSNKVATFKAVNEFLG